MSNGYMKRLTGPFHYDPATCPHGETRQVYKEQDDPWGDYEPWNTPGEWVTESTSWDEDIDIHRFQCTHCGRIGYYSGAARAYHEDGQRSPGIQGLE